MPGRFKDGNIIVLESINTHKNLRVQDDGCVDGKGGQSKRGQFKVHKCGKGIVKFQNVAHSHHWLRVTGNHKLCGKGSGGELCKFRIVRHGNGIFSFESLSHHGCHIGIKPCGEAKPADKTGRGDASRFKVHVERHHH